MTSARILTIGLLSNHAQSTRPKALKVVETLCDVVVVLDDSQAQDHGKYVGGDFHQIVAGLFERGCSLDWSRWRVKERTLLAEHLPSYTWAVTNDKTA